jgi:hypothetical protein
MRNPVGQRWRQAAYDDERYAPITRHVSSSRSLSVLAARFAACPRWKDGEPATRHAQNDSRAVGVAAGRKPADVVGRAMFTLQHVFLVWEIRRRQPIRCFGVHPLIPLE